MDKQTTPYSPQQSQQPQQLQQSDCLSCRITGTAALAGLGIYSGIQARSKGIPHARKVGLGVTAMGKQAAQYLHFRSNSAVFFSASLYRLIM